MGVRVHKLAKELGMTSKELMAYLSTQGHKVKSHMSTVPDTVATILRDRIKPKLPPKPKAPRGKTPESSAASAPGTTAGKPAPAAAARHPSRGPGGEGDRPRGARPEGGKKVTRETRPAAAKPERERGRDRVRSREHSNDAGAAAESRPKEPRRVRYFPSQDYLYQDGGRHSMGVRRKPRSRGGRGDRDAGASTAVAPPEKVEVSPPVTVKDLSAALGLKANMLLKKLFSMGKMVSINQFLDEDSVVELGIELGSEITFKKRDEGAEEAVRQIEEYESREEDLVPRAPVVTFLGHVDHGKTSLLDWIRKTKVTKKESGGITQHIGAYHVEQGDVRVTFIDTPGHQAFTEMRARGANATDVVVLIVAADDGPMPQTEEAINHARAAKVPIVVALNKIDRPNANPQRCKEALAGLGLIPVEWNGDTEYIEVSAVTGQGVDALLETLSLESQILELKANPTRPAVGVVLEAAATPSRGVLATALVQDGTLRLGDYVLSGSAYGRVRGLLLNGTDSVEEAGPSIPVQITGLKTVPEAGEKFYVIADPQHARDLAKRRLETHLESERHERQRLSPVRAQSIDELFAAEGTQEVRLILKADVRGSIEALRGSIEKLGTEEVKINILHTGVGAVSQEDVNLAAASDAIVIGFHVTADDRARSLAEERGVEIRLYRVIYEVIDSVKAAMESRLAPERLEEYHGRAEIRQIYRASRVGNIAGCMVTNGHIERADKVRLIRDGREIYSSELSSLKRFKEDVKEVREGFECGLKIANYEDIKEGDVVEAFAIVEKRRTL